MADMIADDVLKKIDAAFGELPFSDDVVTALVTSGIDQGVAKKVASDIREVRETLIAAKNTLAAHGYRS